MKLSELRVGESYEGPYGEEYKVLSLEAGKKDSRGRVGIMCENKWGKEVVQPRALKRLFSECQAERDERRERCQRYQQEHIMLLEELTPFGATGSFSVKAREKSSAFQLTPQAVSYLLDAIRSQSRT